MLQPSFIGPLDVESPRHLPSTYAIFRPWVSSFFGTQCIMSICCTHIHTHARSHQMSTTHSTLQVKGICQKNCCNYFATGRGSKYSGQCDCLCVCLSVSLYGCLSAGMSQKPRVQTSQKFLYTLPIAVAWS